MNTKQLLAALTATRVTASATEAFEKALNDGLKGQRKYTRDTCIITFRQSITVAAFERVLKQAMKKAGADRQPDGEWRDAGSDGPGSFGYHIEVEGDADDDDSMEEGGYVVFYMAERKVDISWNLF